MADKDYLEFRKNAREYNLISKAVVACCNSKLDLFQAKINSDMYQYPVTTAPSKIGGSPQINNSSNEEYINHNEGVLNDFVVEKAYQTNDEVETAEISDYIWNGHVTALKYTSGRFNTINSDYFTKMSLQRPREQKILEILYEEDITPESTIKDIKSNVNDPAMSLCQDQCDTVEKLLSSILYSGSGMLTVLNTGNDYVAVLGKTSENAFKNPNCINYAPGGVISKEDCRSDLIRDTMLIEFAEEIYDISEERTDTLDSSPILELKRLIDREKAHLDYTGATLDPLRGNIDFNGLLFIDSPSYYKNIFKPNMQLNYEYSSSELVSLTDKQRLSQIFDLETVRPASAYCIIKGLDIIEDRYSVPTGIDISIE